MFHAVLPRPRPWDELVVSSAPTVAHLLSGSDRAEDLDAAHELLCGHLPLEACRCRAAGELEAVSGAWGRPF